MTDLYLTVNEPLSVQELLCKIAAIEQVDVMHKNGELVVADRDLVWVAAPEAHQRATVRVRVYGNNGPNELWRVARALRGELSDAAA